MKNEQFTGNWVAYWKNLQDFIANPKNGLLLDSEIDYDANGVEFRSKGVRFQLTSGKLRRYFVSLWELYDHRGEFKRCVDALATKAIEISREYQFDTIVTCTHSAGEFVKHIQPRIESEMTDELTISEFGHYPWASPAEMDARDFEGRKVLIFTDVMASGTLVRDMAARVLRTGGEVVAILCIVLSDIRASGNAQAAKALRFKLDEQVSGRRASVPLFALTSYPVRNLSAKKVNLRKIRRIDFVNVFPEMVPPIGHVPRALIGLKAMHRQLRQSRALAYGFFLGEKHSYSLAIRAQRLLARVGNQIWESIDPDLLKGAVIVSSFRKDDLLFSDFIRARLAESGWKTDAFVLKREQGDTPHLHCALFRHAGELEGRRVVLLRASATTSEELRSLAALLASRDIENLTVLCLVNRMGPYTGDFVRRIEQLVTGALGRREKAAGNSKRVPFRFIPIYNLVDLRSEDLAQMYERARGVLAKFEATTEVEHFKHLAQTFLERMKPQSLHKHVFEAGGLNGRAGRCETAKAIADAVDDIVHTRSREKLLRLARYSKEPEAIQQLLLLALADVNYLRLTGELARLISAFRKRLRDLRRERFRIEATTGSLRSGSVEEERLRLRLVERLDLEAHILFAWGLLMHFEKPTGTARSLLLEIIFDNRDAKWWHKHPRNLRYHFRDERIYGLAMFLLHAAVPESTNKRKRSQRLIDELRHRSDSLLMFDESQTRLQKSGNLKTLSLKINDLMELLLEAFGAFPHRMWHQHIRRLQRDIILDAPHHNPLLTDLQQLSEDLRRQSRSKEAVPQADLERHLRAAHSAALSLDEICRTARRLSHYPARSVTEKLQPDFGEKVGKNSARRRVKTLLKWIERHEIRPPSGTEEESEYTELVADVRKSIFESTSGIHECLIGFIVPLKATILDALDTANERLKAFDMLEVWRGEIDRISRDLKRPKSREVFVLMDPQLLREVLLNMLTNVRHTLEGVPKKRRGSLPDMVELVLEPIDDLIPAGERDTMDGWSLSVIAKGTPFRQGHDTSNRRRKTLEDHRERVSQFGAQLTLEKGRRGKGSEATLRLISRDTLAKNNLADINKRLTSILT